MKLERIYQKDVKKLAELASEIWHEYWPCILTSEQIDYMVDKFQSENAIINQIENENYTYYFLKVDGNVAGYTGVSNRGDYLFLSKLYIKKEFRHKGYGKKAFEEIKKLGFNRIQLTVNKYNKNTIDAYLKYGFKIINKAVTDIGNGFVMADIGCGYVMDDYIMEFTLTD